MPQFIPSNIPEELNSESFMLWRYEERDGRKTKPPLNPHIGLKGDVTDPSQWTDYETALNVHQSGRYKRFLMEYAAILKLVPVVKGLEFFSMVSCQKREEREVILSAMIKEGT